MKGVEDEQLSDIMARIRYTIEDMQNLAKERGGKCLSEAYINSQTHLTWQCAKGHVWKAVPNHIRMGTWCPECAGHFCKTIKDMQEIAHNKGGKCLSEKYVNSKTHLKWQCKEGHIWKTSLGAIINGHWCPECAGQKRLTIEDLKINAAAKGGKCLSVDYGGNASKLQWQCKKGHTWWATPRDIRTGRWCLQCSGHMRHTLEQMKNEAKKRGGECLSDEYENAHTKLKWKCCEGHDWEAPWAEINKGNWCPICRNTLSENICRGWFEAIFGVKFKKVRPSWLVNLETSQKMELDGFNKDLKLAFEYQGAQHTRPIYGEDKLHELIQRDQWKRSICARNHVTLIEVPYDVSHKEMGQYIAQECKKREISINVDLSTINYLDFDVFSRKRLEEMQQLAKERGGECLSDIYYSTDKKLKWRCSKGHVWEAIPYSIKQMGSWCPKCYGRNRTIEEMMEVARKHGGLCLSKEYRGIYRKLEWQCSKGHTWKATPSNVIRGSWCPYCGHNVGSIEEMRELAKEQGGECLSDRYLGANVKLKWQCKIGHKFSMNPSSVKKGNWCRQCSDNAKKLTIEMMREIARERKGECLSDVYVNNSTNLHWRCEFGHEWWATPQNIRAGHWCTTCMRKTMGPKRLTIEKMREMAAEHGGRCLSEKYFGNHIKLDWQCADGHIWKATPSSVKQKHWCPICARKRRMKLKIV